MKTPEKSQRDTAWTYRRKIILDHTKVSNQDLTDFPVLIVLQDAALKAAAHGGHVVDDRGEDLFLVASDGETRLDDEVETYDPATGALRIWVRMPLLSHTADTTIYLCYGDTRILEEQYESMRAWVDYMREQAGDSYLRNTGFHYGDWLAYATTRSDYPGATTDIQRVVMARRIGLGRREREKAGTLR